MVMRIIVLWALLAVNVQAVSVRDIIARLSLPAFVEDNALTVADDGSGDYLTIAAAVAAARSGDTIRIIKSPHTEGGILLTKDLIIEGLGAANTIIQAHANRLSATTNIFTMTTSTNSVTFRDMTLRHGYSMADSGGAIRFSGYSSLVLERCSVENNDVKLYGGGVYACGTTTVSECTFAGNKAGKGGALYHSSPSGYFRPFDVRNSTFTQNTATNDGGGAIYDTRVAGWTSTVFNCTFVSNVTVNFGGAICGNSLSYPLVVSCAFATNSGGVGRNNGYWAKYSNCTYSADFGSSTDLGGNIRTTNDVSWIDLTLADNGGPTRTHALPTNSVAVDKGSNPLGLSYDQRGSGYSRTVGEATDCGAYECSIKP